MSQINAQNLINPPDFTKGQGATRPLLPPGNDFDGAIREDGTANYQAKPQVTTITLGGTTATNDITTLVIYPSRVMGSQPWVAELPPITVKFTTAGVETPAAVAAGLDAALAAAQSISTLADLANSQRVADVVRFDSDGNDLVLTGANAGVKFTYTLTSTGSLTSAGVTDNASQSNLNIGIVIVADGVDARGRQRCAAPSSASVSADILGVCMDRGAAASDAGDMFKRHKPGADVTYRRLGTASVYGDKGCAAGSDVYVRKVAGAGQVAGAVTDTATFTQGQVVTVTPAVENTTLYKALLVVSDALSGATVASSEISYTSDADANASEIVTGLALQLNNAAVGAYLTPSGTDTLILTPGSGYEVFVFSLGDAALAPVVTQATIADHMLYPGAKFVVSTNQAGSQGLRIAHP